MISMLISSGNIVGVMINMLASSMEDRGFIGGVIIRCSPQAGRSWVHQWFNN